MEKSLSSPPPAAFSAQRSPTTEAQSAQGVTAYAGVNPRVAAGEQTTVPEPSAFALMGASIGILLAFQRLRSKRR